MTPEAWLIVAALVAVSGASLAIRELGDQSSPKALRVYVASLVVAGGLGYWVAEDLDQSGPLGLAAGLAMVEAAPWVWRLLRRKVERKVDE